MARLILNDLKLHGVWLLAVFFFFNMDLVAFGSLERYRYVRLVGAQAGFFFASVMVLIIFLREEFHKGQIGYRSLPISHLTIVSARYASIALIACACMLYGHLFQQIILFYAAPITRHIVTYQIDAGYALEHSIIARGFAVTSIAALSIPLILRFSAFWGILIGYFAFLFIWSRLIDRLLDYSLHTSFFLGLSRWSFFAVVIIFAINLLAFRISVWLYGRRDL